MYSIQETRKIDALAALTQDHQFKMRDFSNLTSGERVTKTLLESSVLTLKAALMYVVYFIVLPALKYLGSTNHIVTYPIQYIDALTGEQTEGDMEDMVQDYSTAGFLKYVLANQIEKNDESIEIEGGV